MGDDQEQNKPGEKRRRFRMTRKVKKQPPIQTEAEKALKEVEAEEDALTGSSEFRKFTTKGCSGCLNLTLLIFVIMIASLIGTCVIQREPPGFLKFTQ